MQSIKLNSLNSKSLKPNKYSSMMFHKSSWLKDAWNVPRPVEEMMTMLKPSRKEFNNSLISPCQLLNTIRDLAKWERLMQQEALVMSMLKVKMQFCHKPCLSLVQRDQERQPLQGTSVKEPMLLSSTSLISKKLMDYKKLVMKNQFFNWSRHLLENWNQELF